MSKIKNSLLVFVLSLCTLLLCTTNVYSHKVPIPIKRNGISNLPPQKAPANFPIPFTASLENSFITYQSTISYTGVTVEIEDENGVVLESQTLNIVAGTAYTISLTGLDAGEYSIVFTDNSNFTYYGSFEIQ
jgi:hypothetical protein